MDTSSLTDSQLQALYECIANGRMGQGIVYASVVLFFYDYLLTVWDEVHYVWKPRRVTLSSSAFMLARYGTLACTILCLLPNINAPGVNNITTILRLISIIASEFIVAVRTWAIWGKSRKILITLAIFSVSAIVPAAIIIGESVISNHVVPLVTPALVDICSITISKFPRGFIVPYVLTILYEFVTLTLSLIQIIRWRRTIPKNMRAPIIDNLWRDGVLYFSFMLVLGFMNIGLVLQQGVPQIRWGGAQLQAAFHGILSTRIVLHLARSKDSRDITAPGISVYQSRMRTGTQFTTQIFTQDQGGLDP